MSIDSVKFNVFAKTLLNAGITSCEFGLLEDLYGLKFTSNEHGPISATLDGEEIELIKSLVLRSKLAIGRVFLDVEASKFVFDGLDPVIANCIIDEIRSKINVDAYHG